MGKNTIRIFAVTLSVLFAAILTGCGSDNTVVTPSSPPSDLTRTGKFIAFSSNLDGNYDIYLAQVNSDGSFATQNLVYPSNPYNLTHAFNGSFSNKQPNWSPNGRILVFSKTQNSAGTEEVYAYYFKASGYIDSSISTNPRQLFSSAGNWDENPQFSPDGKYLVWDRMEDNQNPPGIIDSSDFRDIMRGNINYDSLGVITSISAPAKLTNTVNSDEYDPKWSPRISVQRIAYTLRTSATSNDFDVWIMDPLNPGTNSNFFNPGRSAYPAWAPACDKIIFQADQGNGGFFKIVSLAYPSNNGSTTDIVQSSSQNLTYPTRLPNGDKLAYIRVDALGNGMIYVTSATAGGTGTQLLPVTFNAANNLWPAW